LARSAAIVELADRGCCCANPHTEQLLEIDLAGLVANQRDLQCLLGLGQDAFTEEADQVALALHLGEEILDHFERLVSLGVIPARCSDRAGVGFAYGGVEAVARKPPPNRWLNKRRSMNDGECQMGLGGEFAAT
jgi:hypothetical protein